MKNLYFYLLLVLSFNLYAYEKQLIFISNDYDNETAVITLNLDDKHDIINFVQTGFLDGKQLYKFTYRSEDAYNRITIYKRNGLNVVDLLSKNLNNYNGGHLDIGYLTSVISGIRSNVELELQRIGNEWSIVDLGKKVKKLKFIIDTQPIIGPVGVKDIRFIYN